MRPSRLPRTVWTIDDYQVEMGSDWSSTETANLGFDQFRGQISPRSAHSLPWTVNIGSVVSGRTENGAMIWEGTISAPLQIEADGWVRIAAQGYAYDSSKLAERTAILVTQPEAWVLANTAPFDWPQSGTSNPTLEYETVSSPLVGRSSITNRVSVTGATSDFYSVAFWARGAKIMRLSAERFQSGTANLGAAIFGARGPSIHESPVQVMTFQSQEDKGFDIDLDGSQDFDAVVIEWYFSPSSSTKKSMQFPRIYSDQRVTNPRARDIFEGIGNHMGWDVSGVQNLGSAVFPSFDWASAVMGALTEAAGRDDLIWQVRERLGDKPKLQLRNWGERTWTASAGTGAQWALERMERYNRVTAQFLDVLGQVRSVTVDADPDPLNGRGIKEALVTVGGLVPVDSADTQGAVFAQAVLDGLSPQRYRGDIASPFVYGEGFVPATYEVRAGDTIRLSDWSRLDGVLEDRIASVTKSEGGISVHLEPTVIAGQGLSGGSGSITPGTLLAPTNVPSYKPPAAPGTTTPETHVWPTPPPGTGGDILF